MSLDDLTYRLTAALARRPLGAFVSPDELVDELDADEDEIFAAACNTPEGHLAHIEVWEGTGAVRLLRPTVVIESPYAGDVEANVSFARACLRDSLLRGEAPLASHLLYTQPGVLDDLNPEERTCGIAAGLAWPEEFPHVFYAERGWSSGMVLAWNTCRARNTPTVVRMLGRAGR